MELPPLDTDTGQSAVIYPSSLKSPQFGNQSAFNHMSSGLTNLSSVTMKSTGLVSTGDNDSRSVSSRGSGRLASAITDETILCTDDNGLRIELDNAVAHIRAVGYKVTKQLMEETLPSARDLLRAETHKIVELSLQTCKESTLQNFRADIEREAMNLKSTLFEQTAAESSAEGVKADKSLVIDSRMNVIPEGGIPKDASSSLMSELHDQLRAQMAQTCTEALARTVPSIVDRLSSRIDQPLVQLEERLSVRMDQRLAELEDRSASLEERTATLEERSLSMSEVMKDVRLGLKRVDNLENLVSETVAQNAKDLVDQKAEFEALRMKFLSSPAADLARAFATPTGSALVQNRDSVAVPPSVQRGEHLIHSAMVPSQYAGSVLVPRSNAAGSVAVASLAPSNITPGGSLQIAPGGGSLTITDMTGGGSLTVTAAGSAGPVPSCGPSLSYTPALDNSGPQPSLSYTPALEPALSYTPVLVPMLSHTPAPGQSLSHTPAPAHPPSTPQKQRQQGSKPNSTPASTPRSPPRVSRRLSSTHGGAASPRVRSPSHMAPRMLSGNTTPRGVSGVRTPNQGFREIREMPNFMSATQSSMQN